MIKLFNSLPKDTPIKLAFSGGIDSLAVAHFLRRNRNVSLFHFNHGCQFSDTIENGCRRAAQELGMPITVGYLEGSPTVGQSLEDYWRKARYRFLYEQTGEVVITAHHLDDAIETWVWSSMHGEGKIIAPSQEIKYNGKLNTLLRPFLLTKKSEFQAYADQHGLVAVEDPFNNELHLMRNYMRANMMEHVRYINPGIDKVIRKKYLTLKGNL